MPREFSRTRRVSEQIQRELSVLISEQLQDPRLGLVSVSGVEVSRDLSHAKVYFSTLGDADKMQEAHQVLKGAAGYLRHMLGRTLTMRSVPELHFHIDTSLEQGAHLSALIDAAIQSSNRSSDEE